MNNVDFIKSELSNSDIEFIGNFNDLHRNEVLKLLHNINKRVNIDESIYLYSNGIKKILTIYKKGRKIKLKIN